MCGHRWIKQQNIRACVLCGLTTTIDGKYLGFDKKLVNRYNARRCRK